MKCIGKNATFRTKIRFEKKKRTREKFGKLINGICIGIVFISVRKKWGGGGHP